MNDEDGTLVVLDADDAPLTMASRLLDKARSYAVASRAKNTQKAYQQGVRSYTDWCAELGIPTQPLTAEKMAFFATALAEQGKAWSTINVALASLDYAQKLQGLDPLRNSLEVSEVCEGIRRVHGTVGTQAKPITVEHLRRMVESGLQEPTATRDRALLLLGFSGAFRRSELVSLDFTDLEREENGYIVRVRKSKTDQTGRGIVKGIPYGGRQSTCPVRALDAWREHPLLVEEGPVFVSFSKCCPKKQRLTDQSVNSIVKRSMERAGLDSAGFSGHSLRAGFVTAAAKAGKRLDLIMQQTGHKNVETVMRYIRHVELFRENAAEGLGL